MCSAVELSRSAKPVLTTSGRLDAQANAKNVSHEDSALARIQLGAELFNDGLVEVHDGSYNGKRCRLTSFKPRYCRTDAATELAAQLVRVSRDVQPEHASVSTLTDSVQLQNRLTLIHRPVEGETLYEKVERDGRLDEPTARQLFRKILVAVRYLHRHALQHWDLHPQSIILRASRQPATLNELDVCVMNVGVGAIKLVASNDVLKHVPSQLCCRAPELFDGLATQQLSASVGEQSDAWACGLLLYYMHCGVLPFAESRISLMRKKVWAAHGAYVPAWVSPEARQVMTALLECDIDKRWTVEQALGSTWLQEVQHVSKPFLALKSTVKTFFLQTASKSYSPKREPPRRGAVSQH